MLPGSMRRRPVHGLEHRQQRQLYRQHHRCGVGHQLSPWSTLETTFHQDLNGDGVIGLKPTVIQTDTNSSVSTSLAELGNNYFLYAAGTTNGPELQQSVPR